MEKEIELKRLELEILKEQRKMKELELVKDTEVALLFSLQKMLESLAVAARTLTATVEREIEN